MKKIVLLSFLTAFVALSCKKDEAPPAEGDAPAEGAPAPAEGGGEGK